MNRKLLQKLGAAGLAAATLAACGSTVHTSKPAPKASTPSTSTPKSVPSTPAAPSTKQVGFNASKTAFVLPYKLGDLPAPELALAKSDTAYASGLANPSDWINIKPSKGTLASQSGWYYTGATTGQFLSSLIEDKTEVPVIWQILLGGSGYPGVTVSTTTSVSVSASSLGNFPGTFPNLSKDLSGKGYTIVTPSTLEVRAAPTGKLSVHGTTLGVFCTPSPEAVIALGKVVTPTGLTPITAGPSAVFAYRAPTSPGVAATGANTPTLYDQGAASCASFN
ncbi:MAG: hypothetical protein ACYCU8_04850 [Ferrimicrobium acidiphilum]